VPPATHGSLERSRVLDAKVVVDGHCTSHRLLVSDGHGIACLHHTPRGGQSAPVWHLRWALYRECQRIAESLRRLANGDPDAQGCAWLRGVAGEPAQPIDNRLVAALDAPNDAVAPFDVRSRSTRVQYENRALSVTGTSRSLAGTESSNGQPTRWTWREGDVLRVQLSRSAIERPPTWPGRLLGHEPTVDPRLHLELTGRDGRRLRVYCHDAPADWLEGLPRLSHSGVEIGAGQLARVARAGVLLGGSATSTPSLASARQRHVSGASELERR